MAEVGARDFHLVMRGRLGSHVLLSGRRGLFGLRHRNRGRDEQREVATKLDIKSLDFIGILPQTFNAASQPSRLEEGSPKLSDL